MSSEQSVKLSYIIDDSISCVLQCAFAKLYRDKPSFPISNLAKLLHEHCHTEHIRIKLQKDHQRKQQQYAKLCAQQNIKQQSILQARQVQKSKIQQQENMFYNKLQQTPYLRDLLHLWLPNYLNQRYQLTGCYIAYLTYHCRELEMHNWEQQGHFDVNTPKILRFIGACSSHQSLMIDQILPNDKGKSYEVLTQQQEEKDEQLQQNTHKKKSKYLYIPNVIKQQKMYYFKYPKLGSYGCFPLKIKSYLNINTLEKGIIQYKEYLGSKKQADEQYNEKLSQLRGQLQEAKKKVEDFELNENNASERQELQKQVQIFQNSINQLISSKSQLPQPEFEYSSQLYIVGCDTLGQDCGLVLQTLQEIQQKIQYLQKLWQKKETMMLLRDIKTHLDEQSNLLSMQNYYNDYEKSVMDSIQPLIKQKYPNNDKQSEYELSVLKCQRLQKIFEQNPYRHSIQIYLSLHIPKYKQIVQIALMLLGKSKQQINKAKTNILNNLKILKEQTINQMIQQLKCYELRRVSSGDVNEEYHIHKLLQRLDKIDLDQVLHYNLWLHALASYLKCLCWARIYSKQAHEQAHNNRIKAKEERQHEIQKWEENLQKALEVHKNQLLVNREPPTENQDVVEGFNEEQWKMNYCVQNPKPQVIEVQELAYFGDIQ